MHTVWIIAAFCMTALWALAGATHGDVLPDGDVAPGTPADSTGSGGRAAARAKLVGLAVLTAAGWGLGPVLIEQAAETYGRVTATMMLLSRPSVRSCWGRCCCGVVFLHERPGQRLTLAATVTVTGVLIATLDGLF